MAQDAMTARGTPRGIVVTVLGALQIPAWGSTFYLLAVLAKPNWSWRPFQLAFVLVNLPALADQALDSGLPRG